jgi:hypothetical protein
MQLKDDKAAPTLKVSRSGLDALIGVSLATIYSNWNRLEEEDESFIMTPQRRKIAAAKELIERKEKELNEEILTLVNNFNTLKKVENVTTR